MTNENSPSLSEAEAETNETTVNEPEAQDAPSDSSTEEGVNDDKPELSLTEVAFPKEEKPETDDKKGDSSSESKDEEKPKETGEASDEPEHAIEKTFADSTRFKKMNTEIRELRPLKEENARLKQEGEHFSTISRFMQESKLTPQEMNSGFRLQSLLKNDPKKALEELNSITGGLQLQLGITLPDDLNKKVSDGMITKDVAQETAALRNDKARLDAQNKENSDERARRDTADFNTGIANSMNEWEVSAVAKDPLFADKKSEVIEAVQAAVHRRQQETGIVGYKSKEDAVQMLEAGYKAVSKRHESHAAPRKEIKNIPTEGAKPVPAGIPSTPLDITRSILSGGN